MTERTTAPRESLAGVPIPNFPPTTLENIMSYGVTLTPMMDQYFQIKKNHPDKVLLFRMGDFYEVFFEDAQFASKILNITLTHRGKLGETPIPMAGIPYHAANSYINRLTQVGVKVAICEQIEDPKQAKGIVKREVVQISSKALPYDLDQVAPQEKNYLAIMAIDDFLDQKIYSLTLLEFSSGEFFTLQAENLSDFLNTLELYDPKEFLTYENQWPKEIYEFVELKKWPLTYLNSEIFQSQKTKNYIEKLIPHFEKDDLITTYPNLIGSIGALSFYLMSTQSLKELHHIRSYKLHHHPKNMKIAYQTLIGLEIISRDRSRESQSLYGYLNKTQSALGARKMREYFQQPSLDIQLLQHRLNWQQALISQPELIESIRKILSNTRDIERILAKASTNKISVQDLFNLAQTIHSAHELIELTQNNLLKFCPLPIPLQTLISLKDSIHQALNDELGASLDKQNLIRPGFSQNRDELYELANNTAQALMQLENIFRQETQINNLKIKYNNVQGHFVEVSKAQNTKVTHNFHRKQTLVNCERYQEPRLLKLEEKILSAAEKLKRIDQEIFQTIVNQTTQIKNDLLTLADWLSSWDVLSTWSYIALQENWCKPIIKNADEENVFHIVGAWHPIIKKNLQNQFVCHDLNLDQQKYFALITGPNMAGKTTVMREMVIIQFLSQIGCFVPAKQATLSLCDALFSRLGAHDDITQGQSTFMVEMSETAQILRHATKNSFIILDELGRGTSTYDGLSLAWSILEFLVKKVQARTLFSTHYHELTEVVDQLDGAKNLTVEVFKSQENIEFLYRLIESSATQSYGLHVAKLAGIPQHIIQRSKKILHQLENHSKDKKISPAKHPQERSPTKLSFLAENQLSLFADMNEVEVIPNPLLEKLASFKITHSTPLECMNFLHELQTHLNETPSR